MGNSLQNSEISCFSASIFWRCIVLIWPHEFLRKHCGESCIFCFLKQYIQSVAGNMNQSQSKIPEDFYISSMRGDEQFLSGENWRGKFLPERSPWSWQIEERIWPPAQRPFEVGEVFKSLTEKDHVHSLLFYEYNRIKGIGRSSITM